MTTHTKYRPTHRTASERVGPEFDFATLASLWIARRSDAAMWCWDQIKVDAVCPCVVHAGPDGEPLNAA